MARCNFCNKNEITFIVSDICIELFNFVKYSFPNNIDDTNKIVSEISTYIINNTNEKDLYLILHKIENETNVFKEIRCNNCNERLLLNFYGIPRENFYYEIEKQLLILMINYLSNKTSINFNNFHHYVVNTVWLYYQLEIIKNIDTNKFDEFSKIQNLLKYFAPNIGGPNDDWIILFLTTVGVGVFTNFVYDLLKFSAKKIKNNFTRKKVKSIVEEKIKELEINKSYYDEFSSPHITVGSPMYQILSKMGEKELLVFVKKISVNYAYMLRDELLSLEKIDSNNDKNNT